jgi:predicted transcriptional regulator YdeE
MSIEIGDKKVELKLENKKDYLVYDEPVKGEFVFTNIDIKKGWTIMGRGIKIINSKKSSVITEINYYSQKSESDTLTIVVDFDGSDEIDKKFKTIKVPVKRN